MTQRLALLLELHQASAALQRAHIAAVNAGRTELAASLHEQGIVVAKLIGAFVVEEAKRMRAPLQVVS